MTQDKTDKGIYVSVLGRLGTISTWISWIKHLRVQNKPDKIFYASEVHG